MNLKLLNSIVVLLAASELVGHCQVVMTVAMTAPGSTNASAPTLATSAPFDLFGGNAVALLVTSENGAISTGMGASFAGQPMTLGVSANQANQWAGIFYLINPGITSGQFVITNNTGSSGLAYSAIALDNVYGIADSDLAANTLTSGTVSMDYTTATNGGFVLGAVVNNGFNSATAPAPSFSPANRADQVLHGPELISPGGSGHLHLYGDVPIAGTHSDIYTNRANTGAQRNAYVTLAFDPASAGVATSTFGLLDNGAEFVVNTGAGLVFKVDKNNGNVVSWLYHGIEYDGPSGKHSHLISGLGSAGTTVSATNTGGAIKITIQTDGSNGVVANLTHYLIVSNGVNNVYLATYPTASPNVGELRWITRLKGNILSNGPAPSNLTGNTGAIESGDVFGFADGTTASKYYGDGMTHGKDRAIDITYCGASGNGTGVWMVYGSRESSSGGPFYRDIQNQYSTSASGDQEIYNYMFSGHAKIEGWRLNVLYGPYVLVWNDGFPPSLPIDTEWVGTLDLTGWVGSSGRGSVSGAAAGIQAGIEGVVGLKNATAQYWSKVTNDNYTITGVKPGTYTATLYQGELEVATNSSVNVTAGVNTPVNLTSSWPNPPFVFKIGEWDGTPQGFLNATNILGFSFPNFISMHPSDVRMSSWGTGSNVFNVGSDPISEFPSICLRGTNANNYVNFTLTAGQITNLTLRIGATVSDTGGRPTVALFNSKYPGGKSYGFPSAPPQAEGRTWTLGTYRGFNLHWMWTLLAADLVVGPNTLRFSPVSGSADGSPWLSAGWVYDCVQLDGPSSISTEPAFITASRVGNSLSLEWPSDHTGWRLQAQTNALATGVSTNWYDVPGSQGTNQVTLPVDANNPSVFYRLVYP